MAAKFEISKDHAGKWRFHLKAPNGEITLPGGSDTGTCLGGLRVRWI
jgi:hypothetical protein